MSKRVSTARYPLPLEVDPPTRIGFCVNVPNDIYHVGAFLGQIYALSRAFSWADDPAHTALLASAVWRDIFDNLKPGSCGKPGTSGVDEGVELLIRQNPDNPCELQSSINGTDWCTFADLSLCLTPSGQPGSGSQQPSPGGGQACYDARMQGSGKWLLPTQVSAGDVITITDVSGAATDGSGIWYCGNGQTFFAGFCAGATTTSGSDPKPASPHMRLIAKISGVYYEAYNTSITVPAGVSLANVEFQVNDASLSDNFGELTWRVCVTNNATAVWTHVFDFKSSDNGFAITSPYGTGWTPGTGWVSAVNAGNDGIWVSKACPAGIILTSFDLQVNRVGSTTSTGAYLTTKNDASDNFGAAALAANAVTHVTWGGTHTVSSDAVLGAYAQGQHSASGDKVVLEKLTVTGLGTDPF